MSATIRATHTALLVAGTLALVGTSSPASAQQRRAPRIGVAAQPRATPPQDPRFPRTSPQDDPRWRDQGRDDRFRQRSHGSTVIYVPVPVEYGYGYSTGGYNGQRSYGGVTDANGRPLSASYDTGAPAGVYYTPDLSGSPYSVTDEGMMVVDFVSADRRAFPACAWQRDLRDPQGRPRTIFYQPDDYQIVLRPGQRGRVQGTPPAGAKACYAVDDVGRMVLRY